MRNGRAQSAKRVELHLGIAPAPSDERGGHGFLLWQSDNAASILEIAGNCLPQRLVGDGDSSLFHRRHRTAGARRAVSPAQE